MAQAHYEGSFPASSASSTREVSGWAVGLIFFAAVLMILVGAFHFIEGLVAVLNGTFYVVRPGYDLAIDVSTWGWVNIVGGVIMAIAGIVVFSGALWARIIGMIAASVSALGSFYSIPYYPVWSILVIAIDLAVVWALIVHGRDVSPEV